MLQALICKLTLKKVNTFISHVGFLCSLMHRDCTCFLELHLLHVFISLGTMGTPNAMQTNPQIMHFFYQQSIFTINKSFVQERKPEHFPCNQALI